MVEYTVDDLARFLSSMTWPPGERSSWSEQAQLLLDSGIVELGEKREEGDSVQLYLEILKSTNPSHKVLEAIERIEAELDDGGAIR